MTSSALLRAAALDSKAWPFEEARKLVERIKRRLRIACDVPRSGYPTNS